MNENSKGFLTSDFTIVGNYYREMNEKSFYTLLCVGDELLLEFDPTNKFDTHAIKVMSPNGRYHLGFIDRENAKAIGQIVALEFQKQDCAFNRTEIGIVGVVVSTKGRVMFKLKEFYSKLCK